MHTSLYLPGSVYEALRKIAYDERVKIHDVVMDGIDGALRRRGYPSIDNLKGKKGDASGPGLSNLSLPPVVPVPCRRKAEPLILQVANHVLRTVEEVRKTLLEVLVSYGAVPRALLET